MKTINIKYILLIFSLGNLYSCTKFVTVDPPTTQLITSTVFTNEQTATAAVIGIYSNMMNANTGFFGSGATLFGGLSADEFINYSSTATQSEFAANSLKATNGSVALIWGEPYRYIYAANAILDGLSQNKEISPAATVELQGEAKFIRAFCYFYLINFYGSVPLVLQTSYSANDTLHRISIGEIYSQIINDLRYAETSLLPDYGESNGQRIRPNQYAAAALLARILLYNRDWSGAISEATSVINNVALYNLEPDLDKVFLSGSSEAIWQLEPVVPLMNTWEASNFILSAGPTSSPAQIALTDSLIESFEPGDLRRASWVNVDATGGINSYYPFKYKVRTSESPTEFYIVLRLAEQYLIRAEAEAMLGKISEAVSDLNIIRERAGLADLASSLSLNECLSAVARERRIELFAEWGHRWFDLKRTGQATPVLLPLKPGWQATDTLYPIPQSEIQNDPNLTQNSGY